MDESCFIYRTLVYENDLPGQGEQSNGLLQGLIWRSRGGNCVKRNAGEALSSSGELLVEAGDWSKQRKALDVRQG
jgi:hypothetical protein